MTLAELRAKYAALDLDPRPVCHQCLKRVDKLKVVAWKGGTMPTRKCEECHADTSRASGRRAYHRDKTASRAISADRRHRTKATRIARYFHMELTEVYRACPEGSQVDHIMALRGRTVEGWRFSGLHVPWNLQYMDPVSNYAKGNIGAHSDALAFPNGDGNLPEHRLVKPRVKKNLFLDPTLGHKRMTYWEMSETTGLSRQSVIQMVRFKGWDREEQFSENGACLPSLIHVPVAFLLARGLSP